MATSGTSTLRRGLESTSGFQICHNWFLVRTTFLTTFGGEHKHHFYSDAHADCDDHYDQELTTMALCDSFSGNIQMEYNGFQLTSRLERDLYSRKDKEGIEIREWLKADIRLVLMLSFQYLFLWDGSSLVLLGSWDEL